jgi:hypothetical protein
MMRLGITGIALALASGCVLDPMDGTHDPAETSSVESAVTILPDEGIWIYDEIDPIQNTCSGNTPDAVFGSFGLSLRSSTSYAVFPRDGTPAFRCTMVGARFDCPDRASSDRDFRPSLDARLTITVSATGLFSDDRHQTGKQDVAVTCTGTQCTVLGTFPCGRVHNFNAVAL